MSSKVQHKNKRKIKYFKIIFWLKAKKVFKKFHMYSNQQKYSFYDY